MPAQTTGHRGHHAILPSSHIASSQIARVGDGPIAFGAITDVWEGTYGNKKVLINCLRAPLNDGQTLKKVRSRNGTPLSRPLRNTYWALQSFSKEAVIWRRLRHPNIIPFIGVTTDPLQIISEWTPNRTLTESVQANPGMNRISLVSLSMSSYLTDNVILSSCWT